MPVERTAEEVNVKDKHQVYAAMKTLRGRAPDQATWRRIGQAAGYTGDSDLAGFFGGRLPSMLLNPDGSRSLTPAGWGRAR